MKIAAIATVNESSFFSAFLLSQTNSHFTIFMLDIHDNIEITIDKLYKNSQEKLKSEYQKFVETLV